MQEVFDAKMKQQIFENIQSTERAKKNRDKWIEAIEYECIVSHLSSIHSIHSACFFVVVINDGIFFLLLRPISNAIVFQRWSRI